jgi:hypothetical protein
VSYSLEAKTSEENLDWGDETEKHVEEKHKIFDIK